MVDPNERVSALGESRRRDLAPLGAVPLGQRRMLVGLVVLAALLLGFALWADRQGQRLGSRSQAPELVLLEPRAGAVLSAPVDVLFETTAELRLGPAGWQTGEFHLHAALDGVELMPGASDVVPLPDGRYRWRLGAIPAGARELRLFWSDRRHREVQGSGSEAISIEVR